MKPPLNSRFQAVATIIIAVFVVYASIIATLNFLNTPRIGYVNSSVVMEQYPAAVAARNSLNAQLTSWGKNLKTLEGELKALNQGILAQEPTMDSRVLGEKQEEMKRKQQDYARYNRAVQEKAVQLEQSLMQPVYEEINAGMKSFGEKEGYAIIFGTVAGGNILFAQDAVDLTDEFLAYSGVGM